MAALKGFNQENGRPYNRRIVLEAIRLYGPIERSDIARRVGLTVQTVANIIRELEDLKFISGTRTRPRGRGSPATSLAINNSGGHAIGVHITPRGLEAALIDLGGTIITREHRDIANLDPDMAFSQVGQIVRHFSSEFAGRRLLGIGLAMPGPFDVESMSFVGPTTLEGWRGFPVEQRLADVSGLPAFIEVDHAAAALGERLYGAGKAYRDFYYLYFGVGLGGCMVHEGLPWRGSFGNAGEIGHVPFVVDGEPCPCGNKGCLERYLSLEALGRREPLTGRRGWIDEVAPLLRSAIVTIENLFDPQTIIVGGLAEKDLLAELLDAAHPLPNSISQRQGRDAPRVILSDGGHAGVLRGAAALALAGVLSPRYGLLFASDERRGEPDQVFGRRHVA
jgi:predicted NBD/HSP70 family sugar kinase